ncbi:centriolar coiled-coil protein of 110 kDa isoform X1 [Danio rerio]|uniref:Centriolar coiled-coil protein of 110 kDa isoform X1 n=2 Tax=Danio rerio TaxID=7955 RepID=A0AC58J1A4_DANRE
MESYDDFCARIVSKLQTEMRRKKSCSTAPARVVAHSLICFHGRPVLCPVLSEKQRREMAKYKKRASQVEAGRQLHHNNNLLNQMPASLWTSKAPKVLDIPQPSEQRTSPSPKTDYRNGFTRPDSTKLRHNGAPEPYILSNRPPVTPSSDLPAFVRGKPAEEKQMQEETEPGVCLQNLLKKSREFIEKEQAKPGSKLNKTPSESPSEPVGCFLNGTGFSGSPSYTISSECGLNANKSHRGRPRPISACSIFFSLPENPKPNITPNARPQDLKPIGMQERKLLGLENVNVSPYEDFSRLTETIGRLETSPVDAELTSPLFRRRCHTLDSHLSSRPVIDRSQERMPRFMAGVTARTPTRLSPPSPMNKSPGVAFMGSAVSPESPSHAKLQFEMERNNVISTSVKDRRTDEMQWQAQALEDMQRSLEEDYAFRMSCLMAEQEREHLDSEERVRRLRAQGGLSPAVGEDSCADRYPILSPMCPLSPGDRSPRHPLQKMGFPSPTYDATSPSIQPPVYLRGLKSRNRLSQVLTVEQQRALFRLTAIVKGFLIRRLLKTEKVKNLRQTVQDTQEFISSFSSNLSEQDLCLQERVRAQLRAALFDIHDIFFTLTLEERLTLIQQDRELRTERKLREMEKAKSPKDKVIFSAATQKSLDRKKRVGESPVQTRRAQKTKSPPTKRILQPSQGQNAPVSGQQLLRRGSYKKTPEERVQHSERLKKQHSLG